MNLTHGISVIICCYNSSSRIKPTLDHLALQDISEEVSCEIIVVNNASTDDLQTVVEDTWSNCGSPYPLKVVFEPTPGLAFARRCGVQHAKHSYGIFCDDDNWLSPDYLIRVIQIFKTKPQIGLIGGCSTPVFEDTAPAWFYSKSSSFAIGIQAPETGDITHRGFVWGAGMAFRVEVLKSIFHSGIKPLVSDRKGDILTSGGDGEISAWYVFSGYRIWYDSDIKFQHFIPKTRLSEQYYKRFFDKKYPTLWESYRRYLTLRYFLIDKGQSNYGTAISFAKYLLSILVSLIRLRELLTVMKMDRQVKLARSLYIS
jgi:glycosyltransferase involved in cell wall biosynthesis